jgi:class 3 adenylate cyclase
MKAFGRLVFPRIDKEGDDGLFAKRLGGLQTDVVFAHDGTVAKIVGDAIHVFFGAPGQKPDHAARAIACALALDVSAHPYATALRNEAGGFCS